MAIILRSGTAGENVASLATRLLARYEGLPRLARASFRALTAERGLGEAKTAELKAALDLGKRLAAAGPEERPVITSARDVRTCFSQRWGSLSRRDCGYSCSTRRTLFSQRWKWCEQA